jgi:hypothetical protein
MVLFRTRLFSCVAFALLMMSSVAVLSVQVATASNQISAPARFVRRHGLTTTQQQQQQSTTTMLQRRRIQQATGTTTTLTGKDEGERETTSPGTKDEEETIPTFLSIEDSTINSSNGPLSSVLSITLIAMAALVVIFFVLVLYRKHEVERWNDYRTHQLLAAQEEAFDLSIIYDDDDEEEEGTWSSMELSSRNVS